jgi:hypothetical protein
VALDADPFVSDLGPELDAAYRRTAQGTVALTGNVVWSANWQDEMSLSPSSSRGTVLGFAGFRCPAEVIPLAVRWYPRFGLSYRNLEELLAERGIEVDHVTFYRGVQRFAPLLVDAARSRRHGGGDRWFVVETYLKVGGRWM